MPELCPSCNSKAEIVTCPACGRRGCEENCLQIGGGAMCAECVEKGEA